jgi:hypothetical protein
MASRSGLLLLVLAVLGLLSGPLAHGQIVKEKPAKIKAANRRALRDAKKTDSPYKDSHLDVTRDQLKRGQSTQTQVETSKAVDYKKGTAPNVKPPGFLGLRRDKTTTLVRKEQRQKSRKPALSAEKND